MGQVVMVALALLAVDIDPCHAGVAPVRGIHGAAKRNELGELRRLLGLGVDANKLTQGKITALMWAAAEGHVEAAEILIAAGADTKPKSSCKPGSQPASHSHHIMHMRILLLQVSLADNDLPGTRVRT